ncbi:MAG: tripartite tricarboxylate transporter TctB family protein [Candidatus Rokuibacteriota bacterium]
MTIRRDGVAGLVCLAGSLVLLGASYGLPQPALVPIGPGFYPRILFGVMAALSAALVVADLARRHRPAPAAPARYRLVVLAFVVFAAYVVLLPLLGYRLATFLFVGVTQVALDPPRGRRWWMVLAVALATTVVTYYVFERYLSVLLPRGRVTGF